MWTIDFNLQTQLSSFRAIKVNTQTHSTASQRGKVRKNAYMEMGLFFIVKILVVTIFNFSGSSPLFCAPSRIVVNLFLLSIFGTLLAQKVQVLLFKAVKKNAPEAVYQTITGMHFCLSFWETATGFDGFFFTFSPSRNWVLLLSVTLRGKEDNHTF